MEVHVGLEGRVAVVTGVTSGVGRGIAGELAGSGVRVLGTGRREPLGRELEAEIRADGGDLTFVRADVSAVEDCRRIIDATLERYGQIDILVNNAGTLGDPAVLYTHLATEAWYDDILDTNLKGAFFCSRYALEPMMAQRSGNIVNIASINGVGWGPTRQAAYTASKAGMIALSKTMAVEYAAYGIRVNAIVLGTTVGGNAQRAMDIMRREKLGDDYSPQDMSKMPGMFTGNKLGTILAFLVDDAADFITGAAIAVDGGVSAGMEGAHLPAGHGSPAPS
jgi:NAD(P)-dependent dehydrogenase (short-subunit alcohol dehydrogenase family)